MATPLACGNSYIDENPGKQLDLLLLIQCTMKNEPEYANIVYVADLIAREYERKPKAFDVVMKPLREQG